MNRVRQMVALVAESPMAGEPQYPPDNDPHNVSMRGDIKGPGRDEVLNIISQMLGIDPSSIQKAGHYSLKVSHAGRQYVVRQTSNSVRLLKPDDMAFEVSGCSRSQAAKVIATFILNQRPG